MIWRTRNIEWLFPRPTLVMGILNVTPDSFSDGGRYLSPERALEQGMKLLSEGADIIDVGGESTRPGADPVDESEELQRIVPVIRELADHVEIPISVDTRKVSVARAALEAGAAIVNDIEASREDDAMWKLVMETGAGYVCMHMLGTPENMQASPQYDDVVQSIDDFFEERLARMTALQLPLEQVVLDAGIGFGKTTEHNLQLLGNLQRFTKHERPLLLGVSRKSFIGKITGADVAGRLPGSLAATVLGVERGAAIVRTHDVAATRQALQTTQAILEQTTECGTP